MGISDIGYALISDIHDIGYAPISDNIGIYRYRRKPDIVSFLDPISDPISHDVPCPGPGAGLNGLSGCCSLFEIARGGRSSAMNLISGSHHLSWGCKVARQSGSSTWSGLATGRGVVPPGPGGRPAARPA